MGETGKDAGHPHGPRPPGPRHRQTAQRHPDFALIPYDDAGLTFDALETRYATRPQKEIEAAFSDLAAELLLILDRLLGREVAQQICAAA